MKTLRLMWTTGLVSAALALICLVAGCGGGGSGDTGFTSGSSTQQRNLSPASNASTQTALVGGVNATGVNLLHLAEAGFNGMSVTNALVAPYSASLAVSMLRSGAAGSTRSSLDAYLHLAGITEDVDAGFNKLDLGLKGRLAAGGDFLESVVGWSQTGAALRLSFLDALAVNYGLTTGHADFPHNGAAAAQASWLQQWPDLFPVGGANTRLALGSAMKLSLAWQDPFDPAQTAPGLFQLLDNSTETVSFLHKNASVDHAAGTGYVAVGLPLVGGQQFLIVMPDQDRFDEIEGALTADRWQQIAQTLTPAQADLALPVFSQRSTFAMGLGTAGDSGAADFSGIDGTTRLFVSEMWHAAALSIDAAGLAARTGTLAALDQVPLQPWNFSGVIMTNGTIGWPTISIGITRPFLFAVRDTQTGTVLFLGRILDPLH